MITVIRALRCSRLSGARLRAAELLGRVGGAVGQGGAAAQWLGNGGNGGRAPDPVGPLADPEARDTDPTFTAARTELYFMSTRTGSKTSGNRSATTRRANGGHPSRCPRSAPAFRRKIRAFRPTGSGSGFSAIATATVGTIWEVTRATIMTTGARSCRSWDSRSAKDEQRFGGDERRRDARRALGVRRGPAATTYSRSSAASADEAFGEPRAHHRAQQRQRRLRSVPLTERTGHRVRLESARQLRPLPRAPTSTACRSKLRWRSN